MTNKINAKGIYARQIEQLLEAISYLEESDNMLGYEDDGSGKEYTEQHHAIGMVAKKHAINCIESVAQELTQ